MKKVLLVMSLISVLLLAGCNKNENVDNVNIPENTDNQQQETIDTNQTVVENMSEEEKYKITDGYLIPQDIIEEVEYNICTPKWDATDGHKYVWIADSFEVESDGVKVEIINEKYEESKNGIWGKIKFVINGKEEKEFELSDWASEKYGIIDLDSTDDKKELISYNGEEGSSSFKIYEITRNGLNEIFLESKRSALNSLYKVNGAYIYPITPDRFLGDTQILLGYYMYDNGKMVFVDRFANGEKMFNENGEFNEKFQQMVWEVADDSHTQSGMANTIIENGIRTKNSLMKGSKIKFIKMYDYTNDNLGTTYAYDAELVEDSELINQDTGRHSSIMKGTRLTILECGM